MWHLTSRNWTEMIILIGSRFAAEQNKAPCVTGGFPENGVKLSRSSFHTADSIPRHSFFFILELTDTVSVS